MDGFAEMLGALIYGENTESAARDRAEIAELRRKRLEESDQQSRQAMGRAALTAISRIKQTQSQRGRDTQYRDGKCTVKVRNGHDVRSNRTTTDIVVYDRTRADGGHIHIVLDENGNVITEHWKTN